MEPDNTNLDQPTSQPLQTEQSEKSQKAGTIAAIVFIVILALIGLYLYGALVAREQLNGDEMTEPAVDDNEEVVDDFESIEDDFADFDVESLETTDNQVEADLETAS